MSSYKLVILARFYNNMQAHIIRGKLESEGIECFLLDSEHNSVMWPIAFALGGTRIMVYEKDYQAAKEILGEEWQNYLSQQPSEKPAIIRKPYWKTIFGTLFGTIMGAPSIPPSKKGKE